MKRPEGTCKDCWADYSISLDTWTQLCLVERGDGIDIGWDVEHPMPKLPRRPAPHPGPRCVTHHRKVTKARRTRAHGLKVEATFSISAELYWALYEFQGGRCAIHNCRATGKTRALAVDHDHKCCPGRTSCGKCVRGLLCGVHNEQFGRNGDDVEVFYSMAHYLVRPPYEQFLESRAERKELHGYPGSGSVEQ